MADPASWRTSSCSGASNCVEVGHGPAVVAVRDTKRGGSPVLEFSRQAWTVFLAEVKQVPSGV